MNKNGVEGKGVKEGVRERKKSENRIKRERRKSGN